jgi:hypothetical protein
MPVVPPAILNVITGFVIYHIIPSFLVLVEQAWIAELLWSMASDHKPNINLLLVCAPISTSSVSRQLPMVNVSAVSTLHLSDTPPSIKSSRLPKVTNNTKNPTLIQISWK